MRIIQLDVSTNVKTTAETLFNSVGKVMHRTNEKPEVTMTIEDCNPKISCEAECSTVEKYRLD